MSVFFLETALVKTTTKKPMGVAYSDVTQKTHGLFLVGCLMLLLARQITQTSVLRDHHA
ncbi:hypothetical protein [Marinomonas sp. 2405UD68-3]|uniref:hypothetical protein n=1 Tax=Marinomonas sp. 2405UD68-3 TaxID=3391835 RepID=UPI0039C99943